MDAEILLYHKSNCILYGSNLFLHTHSAKPCICLYNVGVVFGKHEDSRNNQRVMTRVTLKSDFETNKSPFCIQLMILCVFQHKSDVFRLIDVINGVIIGERAKRARHYQGCTNSSWCGTYIYIYIYVWRYVCHNSSACHAYVM